MLAERLVALGEGRYLETFTKPRICQNPKLVIEIFLKCSSADIDMEA